MGIHAFVLALACGAALLAFWIIARFTTFGPRSIAWAIVHVVAACSCFGWCAFRWLRSAAASRRLPTFNSSASLCLSSLRLPQRWLGRPGCDGLARQVARRAAGSEDPASEKCRSEDDDEHHRQDEDRDRKEHLHRSFLSLLLGVHLPLMPEIARLRPEDPGQR